MSTKRDKMIQHARMELDKKQGPSSESTNPKEEKKHSFFSGFALIFLGTMASSVALQYSTILALALGVPFILLGMRRVMKTTANRKRGVSNQ